MQSEIVTSLDMHSPSSERQERRSPHPIRENMSYRAVPILVWLVHHNHRCLPRDRQSSQCIIQHHRPLARTTGTPSPPYSRRRTEWQILPASSALLRQSPKSIWRAMNEGLTSPMISEILKVGFLSVCSVNLFAVCRSSPFQNISPRSSVPLAAAVAAGDNAAGLFAGFRLWGRSFPSLPSLSSSLIDALKLLFRACCGARVCPWFVRASRCCSRILLSLRKSDAGFDAPVVVLVPAEGPASTCARGEGAMDRSLLLSDDSRTAAALACVLLAASANSMSRRKRASSSPWVWDATRLSARTLEVWVTVLIAT